MIVEEKKFQDENGVIGYYEGVYDSSNILKTTYFPKQQLLYISFNRGGVYSYSNVPMELYDEFKNAESQGKFFAKTIKSQPQRYIYRKEFTLYPDEVKELKEVVENSKKDDEEEEVLIHVGETEFDTYEIKNGEEDIIDLMRNVLGFYADKENYLSFKDIDAPIILDGGEQARQILNIVGSLIEKQEKMVQDYEKIISDELKNVNDPNELKNIIDSIKNGMKNGN